VDGDSFLTLGEISWKKGESPGDKGVMHNTLLLFLSPAGCHNCETVSLRELHDCSLNVVRFEASASRCTRLH